MDLVRRWQIERAGRTRASAFVHALLEEPAASDVGLLATVATAGDADHARWELRYARRAAGLLAAQRDALDDRTASLVSAAMARAMRRDPQVAASHRDVAARQFNTRLAAYSNAIQERGSEEGTSDRLGRVLLGFAGRHDPSADELGRAAGVVATYFADASDALRRVFGAAALPADVAPSAMKN